MKITHLLEGAEPKLPGAPSGIKVMTPQQFVAKSQGEEVQENVGQEPQVGDEVYYGTRLVGWFKGYGKYGKIITEPNVREMGDEYFNKDVYWEPQEDLTIKPKQGVEEGWKEKVAGATLGAAALGGIGAAIDASPPTYVNGVRYEMAFKSSIPDNAKLTTDDKGRKVYVWLKKSPGIKSGGQQTHRLYYPVEQVKEQGVAEAASTVWAVTGTWTQRKYQREPFTTTTRVIASSPEEAMRKYKSYMWNEYERKVIDMKVKPYTGQPVTATRVKEQGVDEATKLPAQSRELKGDELTSYLDRIRKQEKSKTDKYKMPYIHRSSVMGYYDEAGKKYNVDAIKSALAQRPKALLKKNEKMKHSDGELEQFFNIGFAALTGIALDENTNELIIVNTCPGAGSCKIDCFAMKGGKIQFQGSWLSDGRILTYLLNDPDGFFNQLKAEIQKEEIKGKKGGYKVSIRWHDAGDFFSPEYVDLAFKLAKELPNVDFYAYTKIADVAIGEKPENFMINWSEGAHPSQERKVKAQDPELEKTKNSRIVPSNLFYDLLVKDEKKNLVKGPENQWQVIPDKLPELKQRLAKEYGISPNSILSYKEWDLKGKKIPNMKWNVIIAPGEPDLTAKDPGVLSTLLLKH